MSLFMSRGLWVFEAHGRVMGENMCSWDMEIQLEEVEGGREGWMEEECVGEDEGGGGQERSWRGGCKVLKADLI